MAKQSLPSVDDVKPGQAMYRAPDRKLSPSPKISHAEKRHEQAVGAGYQDQVAAFRSVNANLPQPHRVIMRDTLRHLQDIGATLNDGTEVTDKTKVVLWLLENSGTV